MRRLPLLTLLAASLASAGGLSACGGDDTPPPTSTPSPTTPTTDGSTSQTSTTIAAPRAYTKNTTRLDAADAAGVAALTALTMYPSTAKDLRPDAVTFAGQEDWRSILLASSFAAKPLGFPLLLMDGRNLPPVSSAALAQLQPAGAPAMNKAQGLRIGVSTRVAGDLRTRYLTSATPAGLARAADRQLQNLRGRPSDRVMIVNSDDPKLAAPAAAWAARSGDPILFTTSGSLPADTKAALQSHTNPRIYVMGGPDTVTRYVISQLQEYGIVKRVQPAESTGGASDLSIAFAGYSDGNFGWNYTDPGHSFVFGSTNDPISAMAAAALSSGGNYGALLLVDRPNHVEQPLKNYLQSVQPGYNDQYPPTRGFFNRGWIIGATTAISVQTQNRLDEMMEIIRTDQANQLGDTASDAANPEGQ
ncbi:MAG: hypothetical protein PGN13_14180 [Patulibacter minatonensis]